MDRVDCESVFVIEGGDTPIHVAARDVSMICEALRQLGKVPVVRPATPEEASQYARAVGAALQDALDIIADVQRRGHPGVTV